MNSDNSKVLLHAVRVCSTRTATPELDKEQTLLAQPRNYAPITHKNFQESFKFRRSKAKIFIYLLEWAIALHGRVLVSCLQMNSTYHDSNIMINLPIWEVISCLLFKYFLRVKSLLYLLVLSQ